MCFVRYVPIEVLAMNMAFVLGHMNRTTTPVMANQSSYTYTARSTGMYRSNASSVTINESMQGQDMVQSTLAQLTMTSYKKQ